MNALLIKTDYTTNKILMSLAQKLGASVHVVKEAQYEDLIFGEMIESAKTNINVSREEVLKKLKI